MKITININITVVHEKKNQAFQRNNLEVTTSLSQNTIEGLASS